jgi:hypothetical protein
MVIGTSAVVAVLGHSRPFVLFLVNQIHHNGHEGQPRNAVRNRVKVMPDGRSQQ